MGKIKKIKSIIYNFINNKNKMNTTDDKIINSNLGEIDSNKQDDVAIIGVSLRFPNANNIHEYECILREGKECIDDYPHTRKIFADKYLLLKNVAQEILNYHKGGYLEDIDKFDFKYFGISPKESELMDPHQRMFLQVAMEAFIDAGYNREQIKGSKTGVFVGYTPNTEIFDYKQIVTDVEYDKISMSIPGNLSSIIPSRVSYFLDLKGPSLLIDTACSSSLVAVHLACKSLNHNECNMAIAGGVRFTLFPLKEFGQVGIESSDDRTRAFDNKADGTGIGEGVAAILLKPLKDAIKDGDSIYAVIKGTAINQDGSSANITAPNGLAQRDVLIKAWENSGVNPETISYIEAHGTGTKLGDPIEVQGINKAFSRYTAKKHFCGIGSVKTNIGHLHAASGIAGLIKCVLSLKNRTLYPSLNFEEANENINFDNSAVYVVTELKKWEVDEKKSNKRRCGISSFGFSGTNCHLVLEEVSFVKQANISSNPKHIVILSARSKDDLYELLLNWNAHLDQNYLNWDVEDLCYTLNNCRELYNHRLAFIFEDIKDLLVQMKLLAKEKELGHSLCNCFYGVKHTLSDSDQKDLDDKVNILLKSLVVKQPTELSFKIYQDICSLCISGANPNWEILYKMSKCKRLHLPFIKFKGDPCQIIIPESLPATKLYNTRFSPISEEKVPDIVTKTFDNIDDVAKEINSIWCSVLGYPHLMDSDNFFEIGGDSISLMQITQALSDIFQVDVSMKYFMEHATIMELAIFVYDNLGKLNEKKYWEQAIDVEHIEEPFGITDIQAAYLVGRDPNFELGGIGTHIYSEIETKFKISQLNNAINLLVKRHPMLRCVFLTETQQQRILKEVPEYTIKVKDISALDYESQQKEILLERERMSHFVFDPSHWPLFEMTALKISENKNYLFFGYDMLIADGLSIRIFEKELVDYCNNKKLPPINFTFRDYIIAYEKFKETDVYLTDKKYHLATIDELPLAPSILLKKNPATIGIPFFKRKKHVFSKECWAKLKNVARSNQVTPTTLLCTAYAYMLNFWCTQNEFTINLTVFNRYPFSKDINKLIGDFTSVILLDFDFSCKENFKALMLKTQKKLIDKLEHRHFDGVSIIRELAKRRNLGTQSLMPIVFTSMLFDEKVEEMGVEERLGDFTFGASQTSQVFLDNQITETAGELCITWDYVEDLFDDSVIDHMFNQYISVIKNLIEDKEVEKLDITSSDFEIITKYNSTQEEFAYKTLDQLFVEQAQKNPNKISVVCENKSYTYKELDERSNQIARYLIEKGVGENDCVGVVATRHSNTIANMLGILKAGGAYVPLEPDYPEERINYILQHSKASVLLTIDTYDEKKLSKYSCDNVLDRSKLSSLAYIIFTSGSTGTPKGVMIQHKAVVNTILDINNKFNITSEDKIIGLSSMCFDLSVYDIFGSLIVGATLYMAPDIKDTDKISEIIAKNQITFWNSVPSVMHLFIENLSISNDKKFIQYESLKHVLLSGDWIPLDLPLRTVKYFPKAEVVSLGGATEASIWSIYYPITNIDSNWKSIPYGYPLANQTFYVLNNNLDYCPVGVEGELYIGGIGVATGYLNDSEKTNKSFILHPIYGYIYRTGDYGVLHNEGYIEFRGRKDDQVKIRGHRIELGEIESLLLKHEGINQAVAIVKEIAPGDKRIIAYVTPSYELEEKGDIDVVSQIKPISRISVAIDGRIYSKMTEEKVVISDISYVGANLKGKLNITDGDHTLSFKLPNLNTDISIKGHLVCLNSENFHFVFEESTEHDWLIQCLNEYKLTLDFQLLCDATSKYNTNLSDRCIIRRKTGENCELKVRTLNTDGITFWNNEFFFEVNEAVEIIFTIEELQKKFILQGKCILNMNDILAVQFNQNSIYIIQALVHLSKFVGVSGTILRKYLEDRLPDYMIPFTYIFLDKMPLTSNQKINRKILPDPILEINETSSRLIKPRNMIESKILNIWKEILKVEDLGVLDNFFELGGDSLQVYQITTKIDAEFQVKIPIDSLYKEPTIANIAQYVKDKLEKSGITILEPKEQIMKSRTIYWNPSAHWKIEGSVVYINSDKYDYIEYFPKLYFITQMGISEEILIDEFKTFKEDITLIVNTLIKDKILLTSIPSWHEIYAPVGKIFKNKYEEDLLFDKNKYKEFKEEQMKRLPLSGNKLPLNYSLDNLPHSISGRRSYRNFEENKLISFDDFSTLLSVLKQNFDNGNYTYFYASSGGLYPLDMYIYVKENRVENVNAGLYYYHPASHQLVLVSNDEITEDSAYVKNKRIFKSSAITIYIVYNAEASMPVYGGDGYFYASIDTGIVVATLTQMCEKLNLGLCSIGDMNFDVIKDKFRLNSNQSFLHNIEIGIKPLNAMSFDDIVEAYNNQ